MAHVHHLENGMSWEWDSMLLLSNPVPLPSPSLEADGSSGVGLRERLRSAPVSSSLEHAGHFHHDSLRCNETSTTSHVHAESRSSDTQSKDSRGDNGGRDPRLDCPNFLAGRVPCACTDNDDDDSGVSRKRSKPIPRCQVAACGAELIDLKGYHQRHRVCLRCAHATRVILRDQPHRYCQQCGKFHPICDFDEGKRSCRRKLEKHNNRRRRKVGEDFLPVSDYGEADTPTEGSPGDGAKADVLSEGEVKDSAMEKLKFVEDTLQTTVISADMKLSVAVKVSEAAELAEISPDIPMQNPRLVLKGNGSVAEQSMIHTDTSPHGEIRVALEHQPEPLAERAPLSGESHQQSMHAMSRDEFPLHGGLHPEPGSQMRREHEEESFLALLMDENGAAETSQFSETDGEHLLHNPVQLWGSTSLSPITKEVGYSSPLPTGRISFKLYDWNPGDFPRQLRQQIMEWLGNMPVDLEGYIRSGCTILTIFVAMPQSAWDDLSADWAGSVLKLVKAEKGLPQFWSSGYLIARLDDQEVHIKNGDLASPFTRNVCEAPVLTGVRPLCLEAGCEEELVIRGHNFEQPQSRFLVSFDGKYVVNDAYHSRIEGGERSGAVTKVEVPNNCERAALFANMPALPSTSSGTAYIEVEHVSGISNYIPLLVAEKDIVDEVRSLEKEMMEKPISCCQPKVESTQGFAHLSRKRANSLLSDLGWVLKNVCQRNFELDLGEGVVEPHLGRLRRLLFFGVRRSWYHVVKKVLKLSSRAGLLEKIGILDNGLSALQVAALSHNQVMVEHLTSCSESFHTGGTGHSNLWWSLGYPGPKGLTVLHFVALQPGAQDLRETFLEKEDGAALWSRVQDHRGQTPQDYWTRKKLSHNSNVRGLTVYAEENRKEEGSGKIRDSSLDVVSSTESYFMRLGGEPRASLPSLPYRPQYRILSTRAAVGVARQRLPDLSSWFLGHQGLTRCKGKSSSRKRRYQLLSSVTILLVCAGLCVMVQSPNEMTVISLSLQRCLLDLNIGSE